VFSLNASYRKNSRTLLFYQYTGALMGLFFKSRRRSSGGGLMGLLVIGGVLYYTGALPVVWDHVKNAGSACYSLANSVGVGGQSVCGAVNNFMGMVDRNVEGLGDGAGSWFADAEQSFDEQWAGSETRMDLENLTAQVDDAMQSFAKSDLVSSSSTLDALMRTGPAGMPEGVGEMGQMKSAMDIFAISQKLMRSQPALSMEWMQKGATMGAFGMPSQLSLGNVYAHSGQPVAAANYYNQALQSLNALQGSNSPAAQQMLGGMSVSPQQLQAQIIATIKQMQPAH
jgi:hypothetical protein